MKKTCRKCLQEKDTSEFHRLKIRSDGLQSYCKQCKTPMYRQFYEKNSARLNAAQREYFQTPVGKEVHRRASKRYQDVHPEKVLAHSLVQRAVRTGKLARQACEICNGPKSEAHHDDYTKPLMVRWLCRQHHMELHRKEG